MFPLSVVLILLNSHNVHAAGSTRTWDGGGSDGNWNTAANWSSNTKPSANNDTARFSGSFGSGGTAITLGGNQNTGTIEISTSTDFSLNNNILTLATGDITRSASSGTTTINSGITLGSNGGAWNISGNSSAGSLVVNGVVNDGASSFSITKSGNGSLTLGNDNTFDGGLNVSTGTLILGSNGAAGTGTLTLSNSATVQGISGTRTINNNLSIGGNLTFSGSEDLVFTDSFDQGGSRTYTVNNTTTFSGSINGSDSLTKSGTGTLILSGNNSLGNTIDTVTVTSGALRVANNGALGNTSFGTLVNSGGALELSGDRNIGNEALTLEGAGVGGAGALRNLSGNSSWAGNITLANSTGVYRINSDAGTLTIGGNVTESGGRNKDLTFGGAGNVTVNGAISASSGDMRLFKDGEGTLTLTGTNTYDGSTTLSDGVTSVATIGNGGSSGNLGQASNAAANLIFDGGTLRYTGATASTNRNFTINSNRVATIDVSANTLTMSGASVSTNGGLTKDGAGTLVLSGGNLHTGDTVVHAGTLKFDGTGGVASTRIVVGDSGSSGATLDVTTKSGGLIIASGNTVGGVGTINGNVTIQSGGSITPGNSGAGTLNTDGNISLESGASLGINLEGVGAGSGYSQLNVTGGVTLAGMLAVNLGFVPDHGDLFFIVNNDGSDAVTGTFSNASVNGEIYTLGGRNFQISYFGDTFTNSFTGGNDVVLLTVPEPASALLGGIGILLILRRRRIA